VVSNLDFLVELVVPTRFVEAVYVLGVLEHLVLHFPPRCPVVLLSLQSKALVASVLV
jgi:hypothetical protein